MTRWVYCMTEGKAEPVKIGITRSLGNRLCIIRSNTWRDVSIVWATPGTEDHERRIKDALRPRHIRTEWFRDPDDFVKAVSVTGPVDPQAHRTEGRRKLNRYLMRRWPQWCECYGSAESQRVRAKFDVVHQDIITALASEIGITLTDADFERRDFYEVERIIKEIEQEMHSEVTQ